jgi:hypothetical protein
MDTEPTNERPRPNRRGLIFAACYGAIVAVLGYAIAQGNLLIALLVMIFIGVLFRFAAHLVIKRRGRERPPWWKWL